MHQHKKVIALVGLALAASVLLPWSSVGLVPLPLILSPIRAAPILVLGLASTALMLTGDRSEGVTVPARVIVTTSAALAAVYAGWQSTSAPAMHAGAVLALCASVLLMVGPWWKGKI